MAASATEAKPESYGFSRWEGMDAGVLRLDTEDGEILAKQFSPVRLVLGSSTDLGEGKLFVTTRRIIWSDGAESSHAYAAEFQKINMHAISSDQSAFQRPCIYMQMEPGTSPGDDDADDDGQDDDATPEVRLVPSDASALEEIFQALCDCAALNPDPGLEDDDEDAEFFYDEEEVLAGAEGDASARAAMLDHYDSLLQMPRADELDELVAEDPERFDDPDEEGDFEDEEEEAHPNNVSHPTRPEQ